MKMSLGCRLKYDLIYDAIAGLSGYDGTLKNKAIRLVSTDKYIAKLAMNYTSVSSLFGWDISRQGYDFWNEVYKKVYFETEHINRLIMKGVLE